MPVDITYLDLLLAAVLVVASIALSWQFQLGMERDMMWGAIRSFIQLALVGFVLGFIFQLQPWYWAAAAVVAALGIMLGVAIHTAAGRTNDPLIGKRWIFAVSIACGSLVVLVFVIGAVLRLPAWYNPRYVLPLAGMIIGNGMNAAALAVNRFAGDLRTRRLEVETALALGATASQAVHQLRRDALRTAIIPSVNGMLVVGIVSLPGMMTGQIIAGQSPTQAVHYQIMVMYMITAAASFTSVIAVIAAVRQAFTNALQLR